MKKWHLHHTEFSCTAVIHGENELAILHNIICNCGEKYGMEDLEEVKNCFNAMDNVFFNEVDDVFDCCLVEDCVRWINEDTDDEDVLDA